MIISSYLSRSVTTVSQSQRVRLPTHQGHKRGRGHIPISEDCDRMVHSIINRIQRSNNRRVDVATVNLN